MARSVCSHPFRPFHMQNCCGNRAEPSRLCSSCIILTIHHTTYIAHKTCRLKSDNALELAGAPLLQLRPRIGLQLPLGAAPKYIESDHAACCLCMLNYAFYTIYSVQNTVYQATATFERFEHLVSLSNVANVALGAVRGSQIVRHS